SADREYRRGETQSATEMIERIIVKHVSATAAVDIIQVQLIEVV
ncbi:MAG: hypothetical protein RL369_1969, partial [Pseudomonadota bacterium]